MYSLNIQKIQNIKEFIYCKWDNWCDKYEDE